MLAGKLRDLNTYVDGGLVASLLLCKRFPVAKLHLKKKT